LNRYRFLEAIKLSVFTVFITFALIVINSIDSSNAAGFVCTIVVNNFLFLNVGHNLPPTQEFLLFHLEGFNRGKHVVYMQYCRQQCS